VIIIVTQLTRHSVLAIAAVNLMGALILLAVEYPHYVPIGSYFPDPTTIYHLACETATRVAVAIVLGVVAQAMYRRIIDR
jgi:hypothetical protein